MTIRHNVILELNCDEIDSRLISDTNMNCVRLLRTIQQQSIFKIVSVRCVSNQHHPLKFLEVQERWREKDSMSKRWQLIYKAPMEKALNYATAYLTFSTVTTALCGIYYAGFVFDVKDMNNPVILGDDVVIADSGAECLIYLGAFILFHTAVKVLLSKYVIRMYQDGDNFTAVFRGHWFNSTKKHEFKLHEFEKLKPTFVVSWGDARFGLGKKHGIILENYFKTPEHFNYLLDKKKSEELD